MDHEGSTTTRRRARVHELERTEADQLTVTKARALLAASYADDNDMTAAISEARRVLHTNAEILGDDADETRQAIAQLADYFIRSQRWPEAVENFRRLAAVNSRLFGADEMPTLGTRLNLGVSLAHSGRRAEALEVLREALLAAKGRLGDGHPVTVACNDAYTGIQ